MTMSPFGRTRASIRGLSRKAPHVGAPEAPDRKARDPDGDEREDRGTLDVLLLSQVHRRAPRPAAGARDGQDDHGEESPGAVAGAIRPPSAIGEAPPGEGSSRSPQA